MSYGSGEYGSSSYGASSGSGDASATLNESITVTEGLTVDNDFASVVAETLTLSEQVAASQSLEVVLSESLFLSERISTGSFQIENFNGDTIVVTLPDEYHFDDIIQEGNFALVPNPTGVQGVPLRVLSATPSYTLYQQGSNASVRPAANPNLGSGATPSYYLNTGLSNVIQVHGFTSSLVNAGDFLFLRNGQNYGLYQILDVLYGGPPASFLLLDKPMTLQDDNNGILNLPVTLTAITNEGGNPLLGSTPDYLYTFQVDDPRVTPSTPLKGVYQVLKGGRQGLGDIDYSTDVVNPPSAATVTEPNSVDPYDFAVGQITFIDYRTFQIRDANAPPIVGAPGSTPEETLRVTIQLDSHVSWAHVSGVTQLTLKTTKMTEGADYLFQLKDVYLKLPRIPYSSDIASFKAVQVPKPRVAQVRVSDEGVVTVLYGEDMQSDDANLTNRFDYAITGPSSVRITKVRANSSRSVALYTSGLVAGDYTLTVSTNTPKDIAGNPLDATYSSAVFTASTPLTNRSIFTDKGPIVRPPLTLQSGTAATLDGFNTISLPGAALTLSDIGKRLTISGSAENDGPYKVLSIVDSDTAKVQASFNLPDANDGAIDWALIDPREGQIADDPSDVTVRINSLPVIPDAVIGLRGQIVLPSEPGPTDDVQVDYGWCCNPTVEIRRLNSKEFRLNGWNRDHGGVNDTSHHYRFNNVLTVPENYQTDDITAGKAQPLLRQLKYRAYERAYSALLNDPNRLLLNTPTHRIAYPPARRTLAEVSVFYEGTSLPENASAPWIRKGAGTASAAAGILTLTDNSTGTFPAGQPVFWTKTLDLTFTHVFSAAWRTIINTVTTQEGVWTGIAAGYADERVAYVVGYLDDGGVKKIGFFKRNALDDVESVGSWIGGVDSNGDSTGQPVAFDWSTLHSYRLFRDQQGTVRLYIDGDVVETLRITPDEAPFLLELNAPFDEIQGAFFGSLSRPAESSSQWDFFRYLIQPINAQQVSPSSFVSYEANTLPELDPSPWTPLGYHGNSVVRSLDYLEVNATSGTDASTSAAAGLIGGDFRGYTKIEPLLSAASEFSVDVNLQLLTHTHGLDPNGVMVAVDDGNRLMQLSFIADASAPLLSYGGRSFPEDFSPYVWSVLGTQAAEMLGRVLRITDSSMTDGLVYFIEDLQPVVSEDRVTASSFDYFFESQIEVVSYTVDADGFAGAFVQNYDGLRVVGFLLREVAGVRYVAFHSDGVILAQFAFEWADSAPHVYRVRKSTGGDLVSLFADGTLLGTLAYSSFTVPGPDPVGVLSFGSSTAASSEALSEVEWHYCNAWRVVAADPYVGLWRGTSNNDLRDYHLPLKTRGHASIFVDNTMVLPNTPYVLKDILGDFSSVVIGDPVIIDVGGNAGVFEVASIVDAQTVTVTTAWPLQPTQVDYRIAAQTNWAVANKYRLFRDSSGNVSVFLNADPLPLFTVAYNSLELPESSAGVVDTLCSGLPAIAFGAFSAENLSQSLWDFVRYGITRSPTELRIVPLNHVLNQWNVIESPERLYTTVPHDRTDFKSSSTGITPQTDPDFLDNTTVPAYTQLNEGTPLVPQTQSFEVRGPYTTVEYVSALNRPEDVLNNDGDFTLNDGSQRFNLVVPDDVLYASLRITSTEEGERSLIKPFDDDCGPQYGSIQYQKEVCLEYTADTLPEEDATAPTPWSLNSDAPAEVSATVFGGILTYGTSGVGTRTVYLNNTPLPDAPSLQTEVNFRLRLVSDATGGTGDSQVRFGISAPGMTLGLGFVTTLLGERLVIAFDINSGSILGALTFDYLDGAFHTYRIVRTPTASQVEIFIDA